MYIAKNFTIIFHNQINGFFHLKTKMSHFRVNVIIATRQVIIMFTWISNYFYCYTVEEEAHLYMQFGYIRCHFLLLDEPRIPLITVKANTRYHL